MAEVSEAGDLLAEIRHGDRGQSRQGDPLQQPERQQGGQGVGQGGKERQQGGDHQRGDHDPLASEALRNGPCEEHGDGRGEQRAPQPEEDEAEAPAEAAAHDKGS